MTNPSDILKKALAAAPKDSLDAHLPAIEALRVKGFTWRDIADFLTEQGIPTDHSKVFRLWSKHDQPQPVVDPFPVPPAAEYTKALLALDAQGQISKKARAMLEHHYLAHNRTVTYTALAQAAADAGHDAGEGLSETRAKHVTANSAYGTLGRRLGEAMGMSFADNSKGRPFYSSALGLGHPLNRTNDQFHLVMHHELAKALDTLGWFPPAP